MQYTSSIQDMSSIAVQKPSDSDGLENWKPDEEKAKQLQNHPSKFHLFLGAFIPSLRNLLNLSRNSNIYETLHRSIKENGYSVSWLCSIRVQDAFCICGYSLPFLCPFRYSRAP